MTHADFVLPSNVVSKVDVSHLVNEVERVDGQLIEAAARADAGSGEQPAPQLSQQLTDFLALNNLNLDNSHERSELIKELRLLKDKVPVVHMTFAVEADQDSLRQLTEWLRASVHPQSVIAVGLQPGLVAGVYIRTPNRVHDLSLRAIFNERRHLLVEKLEKLHGGE